MAHDCVDIMHKCCLFAMEHFWNVSEEYNQCSSSIKNESNFPPCEFCYLLDRGDNTDTKNIAKSKAKSEFLGKSSFSTKRIYNSRCKRAARNSKRIRKTKKKKSRKCKNYKRGTALLRSTEGTFYVHKVFGDGNCMFRAMSFILWETENEYKALRIMVVEHIKENWREYGPFVIAEWNISNRQEYSNYMISDGTFASELECTVLAKLHRMNLSIYREIYSEGILKQIFHNRINRNYPTARLLFSGHSEIGHYDVLLRAFS